MPAEETRYAIKENSEERLRFKELCKGDVFHILEEDGVIVSDEEGNTLFKAESDPYIHPEFEVWTIETISL